ncbi:sulfite exporter TauE/SafE family protein [Methylobacterium nonmethylotrophicum]|uniref:Probable membrane transporter protein n=1 Tax=Methylobacterium nonmethylotrophicum TaxID=1141884 RepID=A0A4Z0ND40_9HYPH|nr:sulfite exporter TauE/SafE family protein [Methylobacterium nonmethylotrophicum]TGD92269.1 sulfite exporter TauE/SafE family protein [Methylobacterium nonmethylotrophicum]
MSPVLGAALILGASTLYATAGQAGGTAFLAVMALAGVPAADMRPTSLVLNLVAAGYATARLHRAGAVAWPVLLRLLPAALPAALLGGLVVLEGRLYLALTGALLLAAAGLMLRPRDSADMAGVPASASVGLLPALLVGGGTGFVSGLTGVGGGVFLAPLLIALGWASARGTVGLSAPYILANSAAGFAGVFLAGGHGLAPGTPLYAAAALAGAVLGTAVGLRWMTERATRRILALLLALAGLRLLLR